MAGLLLVAQAARAASGGPGPRPGGDPIIRLGVIVLCAVCVIGFIAVVLAIASA